MAAHAKGIKISRRLILLMVFTAVHAFLLLPATYILLDQDHTYGDEKFLMKWSTVIKKIVLGFDDKPPKSDLFFINTCYDNMLIDKLDEDGFPIGNQVITDREKLAALFSHLNRQPDSYKYVICDIFFEDESPADDALRYELSKAKNVIIPYSYTSDKVITYPVFDINQGLAEYNVISGSFLKYRLVRGDTLFSLPLKMYCGLTGAEFEKGSIFSSMNGRLSFNNILIDYRMRYYDILSSENPEPYPLINLGELLILPDSVISASLSNRIIVIGDLLGSDIHPTVIGDMPGPLILLNAYLTLENRENIISLPLILILFSAYFFISFDILSVRSITDRKFFSKYSEKRFGKFIRKFLEYVMYLSVVSVVIYFLYNIHINILVIAVYLKFLDSGLKYFRKEPEEEKPGGYRRTIENCRIAVYKLLNK